MDVTSVDTVFIGGWEREVCQVLKQTIALDVTSGQGEALGDESHEGLGQQGRSKLSGEKPLAKRLWWWAKSL